MLLFRYSTIEIYLGYFLIFLVATIIMYKTRNNFKTVEGKINCFLLITLCSALLINPVFDPALKILFDFFAPNGTSFEARPFYRPNLTKTWSLGIDYFYNNPQTGLRHPIENELIYRIRIAYYVSLSVLLITFNYFIINYCLPLFRKKESQK